MERFTVLRSHGVSVLLDDIDTDMLFPAQFCKTLETTGLGQFLFARERYPEYNSDADEFPLNLPEHAGAQILVSGRNFGCGSSREHAVWALRDYGFRCVVAESFSDILYANCFKNGMLPVALPRDAVDALAQLTRASPGTELVVDLIEQTVRAGDLGPFRFSIEPHRRHMLLEGLDEVGLTLAQAAAIDAFETSHRRNHPWLARLPER